MTAAACCPGLLDPGLNVEPLTEEKAARTLYRIELLRKIREQVCQGFIIINKFHSHRFLLHQLVQNWHCNIILNYLQAMNKKIIKR